jgi:hypothetical protein
MPIQAQKQKPRASYAADPGLQLVNANVEADLAMARAQADQRRKDLLMQYGSPELASTIYGATTPGPTQNYWTVQRLPGQEFGSQGEAMSALQALSLNPTAFAHYRQGIKQRSRPGPEQPNPFVQSVGENPFSALSRLKRSYGQNVEQTDDALNKANLYFSGFRGKTLADLAYENQMSQYDATTAVNRDLQAITDFLLAAEQDARARKSVAELEAYNRALGGVI